MRDGEAFDALARRLVPGGRLVRVWPLEGGVSAAMHGLEVECAGGGLRRLVVRRHGAAAWKDREHDVTATEFALLQALREQGVPVPEPLRVDTSCELLPTAYLVMAFVEGTTTVADEALPGALRQMAETLARLHALDVDAAELPPLPAREDPREAGLAFLPKDALGDRLRTAFARPARAGTPPRRSLLHGDYWPGNILWQDGRLAALLDWEDAALGDPLSDLACARVELLCGYGEAAMDAFTEHYCALARVDLEGLALWEIYVSASALATMGSWGLAPADEARRRRSTRAFLERAAESWLARGGA